MGSHISYREHLNILPDVFSISDVKRHLNLNDSTARVYISRWADKHLIQSWASKSGLYFNLVSNQRSPSECLAHAVHKKFPQAILIGPQIIRAAGWITQISNLYSLALNVRPGRGSTLKGSGYPEPDGITFEYRPRLWWHAVNANRISLEHKELFQFGFKAVTPGFALVDMWLNRQNEWFPDSDDLYLDDYANSYKDIESACQLLKVDFADFCESVGLHIPSQTSILFDT